MNKHERDASIERLLRHAMQDDARATGPCLQAETIAAWVDGTLSTSARASAEAHAASCLQCQAVLAAMARTADAGIASSADDADHSGFARGLRWLAPFAAVSAAAAIVISIWPAARPPIEVENKVSQPRLVETPVAEPSAAPARTAPPTTTAAPMSPTESRQTDAFAASKERSNMNEKTADAAASRADRLRDTAGGRGAGAVPPPELQRRAPGDVPLGGLQATPSSAPLPPAAPPAPLPDKPAPMPAQQSQRREPSQQTQQSQQSPTSQQAQVDRRTARPTPAGERLEETSALAFQSAMPAVIATPVSTVVWRIVNGRDVQRSDDGGTTWTAQTTVADARLAAGSCPTTTACWIVGEAGTVLRTTDGRTWQRTLFVDAVELAAVRATDADNAVITTRDGRTFVTNDGGKTWVRQVPAG